MTRWIDGQEVREWNENEEEEAKWSVGADERMPDLELGHDREEEERRDG